MTYYSKCPKCKRATSPVTIKKGECDKCRIEARRKASTPVQTTVADIRGWRKKLLEQTDWTQLEDVPSEIKERFKSLRKELRDITNLDIEDSTQRLKEIEKEIIS